MSGVELVSPRGAKITVSEGAVDSMIAAGFRKASKPRHSERKTSEKKSSTDD